MRSFLADCSLPFLRLLDPEQAHTLAVRAISLGLAPRFPDRDDPALAVTAFGRQFTNPIGLAAGFDKNAACGMNLFRMGFGFIETGSITPLPQAGNPRPRLFRLSEDRGVINRLGFNNLGLDRYLSNLARLAERPAPLGANLGINKEGSDPERDYPMMIRSVSGLVDYAVINVSSPNTPGLRDLQSEARLRSILAAVMSLEVRPPILVKIAPDLSQDGLASVVETCVQGGVQGLIVGNTTISRPPGLRSPHARQSGGLSGQPLQSLATTMLARAYLVSAGRLTLIGTGGIFTGADALRKVQAGASLVQLYSGFALLGPSLIPKLKRELLAALHAAGYKTIRDAVGTGAQQLAEPA